jgi:GTP cyclohydrolase I
MRGVREIDSKTRTTNWRGAYEEDQALRNAFFTLSGLPSG